MRKILSTFLLLIPFSISADDKPEFKVAPSGRLLIDGALYASPQKGKFPDGMAIPEVRLGARMSYGKWTSNIDVCYSYAKIGLRNMWVEYGFDKQNSLRFGSFIHQYGLQSTSASLKATYEQPTASALYTPGLQLGAMYVHYSPRFYAAASAHVESSALTQVINEPLFNQQGYGLLSRLIYRHVSQDSPIWHVGISGGFASPQRRVENNTDIHDGFTLSANFPTKVAQVSAIGTTVDKAMNLFKFTPEVVLAKDRFAFEGQYFFQQINRRQNLQAFRSQSGYATARVLLTGGKYSYVSSTAQLANPKSNTLECVLNYNYSTLVDSRAAIFGGRSNVMSVTFNYYFNPYITARLNYFYAHTWDRQDYDPMSLNGFQARLMVFF
ncbi:MAG: OprO/OprP family phosphate-selective porin [Muribaculaceae bacterium]|nr:OprO/OprP family phosphate-selective porin [Muribaculaceae bacterium]